MNNILDFIPNISIPGVGEISIPGVGTRNLSIPNKLSVQTLADEEILKIIIKRLAYKQNPAINANPTISTVFGQPDFLPFPFMSLGIQRGSAVCRLIREFSSAESAIDFINSIRQAEKNRKQPFSISSLAEICCINYEKALEVFELANDLPPDIEIALKPEFFWKNLKRIPVATGFLVGRNKLLTNYHIFSEISSELTLVENLVNTEYIAEFMYEQDILGREIEPIEYKFEKLLAFNKNLDFALIKLQPEPNSTKYPSVGQAGDQFGWIPLLEDDSVIAPPLPQEIFPAKGERKQKISDEYLESKLEIVIKEIDENILNSLKGLTTNSSSRDYLIFLKEKALFGDPVNLIQHPKGRRKEIVLSNNRVIQLTENFIFYEADADFSSSGSPVMNQQWQLVGLHCGALSKPDPENSARLQIDMEIGVQTYQIVQDLIIQLEDRIDIYHQSTDEDRKITRELWFFVNEFVQLRKSKDNIRVLPGFEEYEPDVQQAPQKSSYLSS